MNEELTPEEALPGLLENGPWQKLPQESVKAYASFTRFLELGSQITLQELATDTGRTYSSIANLSSRYLWSERAAAYRQSVSHSVLAAAQRQRVRQTELAQLREG